MIRVAPAWQVACFTLIRTWHICSCERIEAGTLTPLLVAQVSKVSGPDVIFPLHPYHKVNVWRTAVVLGEGLGLPKACHSRRLRQAAIERFRRWRPYHQILIYINVTLAHGVVEWA